MAESAATEHRLVKLKAALSTSNSDITTTTVSNLSAARQRWTAGYGRDDNQLRAIPTEAVMIRTVARGAAKRESRTEESSGWLATQCGSISAEPGKQHVSSDELNRINGPAQQAIQSFLRRNGYADLSSGTIDCNLLISNHP